MFLHLIALLWFDYLLTFGDERTSFSTPYIPPYPFPSLAFRLPFHRFSPLPYPAFSKPFPFSLSLLQNPEFFPMLMFTIYVSFSLTVRFIWLSRFRMSTPLYVFCRYGMIANVLYLCNIAGLLGTSVSTTSLLICLCASSPLVVPLIDNYLFELVSNIHLNPSPPFDFQIRNIEYPRFRKTHVMNFVQAIAVLGRFANLSVYSFCHLLCMTFLYLRTFYDITATFTVRTYAVYGREWWVLVVLGVPATIAMLCDIVSAFFLVNFCISSGLT